MAQHPVVADDQAAWRAAEPSRAAPRRPLILRIGKRMRRSIDRLIASSSLIANDPVLDAGDFAWTQGLRDHWEAIRDEAIAVALGEAGAPSLADVSPDHRKIAEVGKWRSFFLWGYGYPIPDNLARCPVTRSVVEAVPGLNSAFFSILAPGARIPAHRGVTKALVTCHLGLIVPDGDVRMRVDDHVVRWAEGETLVFDDTYRHQVWNDTAGTRVVLLVQFGRPLRAPGSWIAVLFMAGIRRTPFVREAHRNIAAWNEAVKQMDV